MHGGPTVRNLLAAERRGSFLDNPAAKEKNTGMFFYTEGIMEQECNEFDRLFGLFQEMNAEAAQEWLAALSDLDTLAEVRLLAELYGKQNKEIHESCMRCKSFVDCPLEQREEDWLASGGSERFSLEACGLQKAVSPESWGAFAFLLIASEHASERAKALGYKPSLDALWDRYCEAWHARLARRFRFVRIPSTG